jgi:hypothetical protein
VLLDGASDFQRFMIATPVHRTELSSFDPSPDACVRIAHESLGLAQAHGVPLAPNVGDLAGIPVLRNPNSMWVQKTAGAV